MRKASKKSVIAGVLAFSMILTGTGYAYWTDTLNVTTKATTGDLDVTFVDFGLYAQYNNELGAAKENGWSIIDGIKGANGENSNYVKSDYFRRGTYYNGIADAKALESYANRTEGYHSVTIDPQTTKLDDATPLTADEKVNKVYPEGTLHSDKIAISLNNLYPGYAQAYRSDIINIGNLAAKLSNVKFSVSGIDKAHVDDMLGVALLVDHETGGSSDGDTFALCRELAAKADPGSTFTVGGVEFLRLSAFTKLSEATIAQVCENNTLLCKPNDERLDLFLAVAMDPDAQGVYTSGNAQKMSGISDELSQRGNATLSVDLAWDQFNASKETPTIPGNILQKQNSQK